LILSTTKENSSITIINKTLPLPLHFSGMILVNLLLIIAGCAPDEKGMEHLVLEKVNSVNDLFVELSKMGPSR